MKRERMVILLFAVLLAAIPVVPALLLSQHTPKSESESLRSSPKRHTICRTFPCWMFPQGRCWQFRQGIM